MAYIAILPILLLLMTFGNTINAGITRQLDQMLPNNERITRSIHNPVEDETKSMETIPIEDASAKHRRLDRPVRSANNYDLSDLSTAENNVVFKPLFRKRPNRRVLRSTQDDLQAAENNVVFKPLFRRRPNKRIAREAKSNMDDDMQVAENNNRNNLRGLRRSRRSALDDMQTAENNIVFKPLFRRHPVRRVRSADYDLDIAESQFAAYYGINEKDNKKEEKINTEDESDTETADNEHKEDAVVDEIAEESSRFKRAANQNGGDELMETAANTIVFRPLFRNNRRNFNRQRN